MLENSFLEQLRKKKQCLRPQETLVTSEKGERFIEKLNDSGELKRIKLKESCYGFVVDDKPDLEIAEILPYLFLSSQDVVQSQELLKKNIITHVLSIGIDIPSSIYLPNIVYKKIHLLDLPEADLLSTLEECFKFIDEAKAENVSNRILVHCNAGYSRSPSVITAYLMKSLKLSLREAIEMIKEKRNVSPNVGFMRQLKLYETQLTKQNGNK